MANQYQMVELTYHAPAPAGSKVTVDLRGEFACGDEQVTVKGFYDGDDTYKVRFLPMQAGVYAYKISGIVADEGTVTVEPAAEGKHGIPKANGCNLQFSDGTWFNAFGTTIYALAHQTDELMDETIETLSKAPFNKVRMCVFPKHYQYNHNEPKYYAFRPLPGKTTDDLMKNVPPMGNTYQEPIWDVNEPDFRFWQAFEGRMKQLDDLGIVIDLILFHPYDRWGFSCFTWEQEQVYLDYLLRRFAAMPNLMWSMSNEYDLIDTKPLSEWHAMDEFLAKEDPYHHMISNHNIFRLYDFERPTVSHVSIQIRAMNRVPELIAKYGKPVLYDECAYEGNLEEAFGSITGQEMSDRFWKVTVSGGYCTHGECFIDYDQPDLDDAVVYWAKGGKLIGESPERIGYLREFVDSLPGPIEPTAGSLYSKSQDELKAMLLFVPGAFKDFVRKMAEMEPTEFTYHAVTEADYSGHVGDQVFIFYYGADQHARVTIDLPADKKYSVDIIDTWNMTRENILTGASGRTPVRLPQKQWMAVVATAE